MMRHGQLQHVRPQTDVCVPAIFPEVISLAENDDMPEGEDLRRWIDNPIEGLRRDIRSDVRQQFEDIKREIREFRESNTRENKEYRDELKSSQNERMSKIEKELDNKASKRVEHGFLGLCVVILLYVLNLWLGAIELKKAPIAMPDPASIVTAPKR